MTIEHIIFLIHPCCYEAVEPERARKQNLKLFIDREREVKQRWLDGFAGAAPGTFLLQLGGPHDLTQAAVESLGEACVLRPSSTFSESEGLRAYYSAMAADFHAHLAAHDLQFDPATVTSELWGESFEGCVPGYGGAFAEYLKLQQSPKMRFEMTVYDSRFLYDARRYEVIPIGDSDVEAWVFELHDGTGAAMFQARRTAQWVDERRLHLMLDDSRLQVSSKRDHTIWPAAPWDKYKPEQVLPYSMTLSEANWNWVRAVCMGMDEFRDVIRAARVE